MNGNNDIEHIVHRIQQGNASPSDLQRYQAWCDAFQREPKPIGEFHPISQRMLGKINRTIHGQPANRPKRMTWLPYAAALIIATTAATWLFYGEQRENQQSSTVAAEEILPGGNKATLTLADGRVVNLSSEQEGIVIQDGITYLDGTEVIENGKLKMENEGSTFNSITTPKGGTYQVTLPDGSQVWLNANSTIKYPSRFSGDVREVILEGEAFFAVSSQPTAIGTAESRKPRAEFGSRESVMRTPFKVMTSTQTVEVLGTEFNISAYADDPETKTTLVEGKVKVTPGTSDSQPPQGFLLSPGQQAIVSETRSNVLEVDIDQYISWKKGDFVFNGQTIAEIMPQLARWYDITVEYQGAIPRETFYGKIARDKNIDEVLRLLEKAEGVHFSRTGRRVVVMK